MEPSASSNSELSTPSSVPSASSTTSQPEVKTSNLPSTTLPLSLQINDSEKGQGSNTPKIRWTIRLKKSSTSVTLSPSPLPIPSQGSLSVPVSPSINISSKNAESEKEVQDIEDQYSSLGDCIGGGYGGLGSMIEFWISSQEFKKSVQTGLTGQLFLRDPQRGQALYKTMEYKNLYSKVKQMDLRLYVHSPMIINLSNPVTKKNPYSDSWILGLLTQDLTECRQMGGRGVVVHVGKSTNFSVSEALDRMEMSIRSVLKFATEDCPLILETPAGQGTELCSSYDEFSNFYNRFSALEKRIFKICIDTCHVFAAGHDPYEYIIQWERDHPGTLVLIHFNDSKKDRGCRVDRHCHFLDSSGYIGIKTMNQIYRYGKSKSISMVIE